MKLSPYKHILSLTYKCVLRKLVYGLENHLKKNKYGKKANAVKEQSIKKISNQNPRSTPTVPMY